MHTGPGCTCRGSCWKETAQHILLKVSSPHSTTHTSLCTLRTLTLTRNPAPKPPLSPEFRVLRSQTQHSAGAVPQQGLFSLQPRAFASPAAALPPRSADRSWAASSRGSSPEGRRCFLPAGSDGNLLSESVCGGRHSLSQLSGVSMRFSRIYSCELLFLLKEEEEPIESFTPRSHFCCRTSAWPWGS